MLARELRHEVERHARRVRDGLVLVPDQPRQRAEEVPIVDDDLRATSAPIAWRHLARVFELVVGARLEATENVCSGRPIIGAINAAIALLSMPPDRNTPSGTSLIRRSANRFLEQRAKPPDVIDTRSRVATACVSPVGTSQ